MSWFKRGLQKSDSYKQVVNCKYLRHLSGVSCQESWQEQDIKRDEGIPETQAVPDTENAASCFLPAQEPRNNDLARWPDLPHPS